MPITYTDNSVGKLGLAKPDRYTDEIWTPWADNAEIENRVFGGFLPIAQGDANYTLLDTTAARESRTLFLKFTSTLTANREVKIDTTTAGKYSSRMFLIWNASSANFKLTIKTTAGGSTGPDVNSGKIRAVIHDGTNVYPWGPEFDAITYAMTGNISFADQVANRVFAGPTSGANAQPAFRALVNADLPGTIWARAYHNAAQSIANVTTTALALNSEREDTDTIHDTATNNSRLTCKTAGVYAIWGCVEYAANAAGVVRSCSIRLNGATYLISFGVHPIQGGAVATALQAATVYRLAVNDYVELMVYQDSGGALNVNSAGNYSPEFSMLRLGS